MKIKSTRERLLASTIIVGALALAGTGHAMAQALQTAPPTASTPTAAPGSTVTPPVAPDQAAGAATAGGPGSTASTVQEVVVTGSRIAGVTNLTSASPVAVASHQDIVLSKANSVEEVIDRLPQIDFNGGLSNASNNGGAGLSEISIRNLGPARVLVLIDGQRVIPNGGAVDYNIIPLEQVDHVEVLKDGASSIYGADAIAGVVNVITKKNFQGVDINANYGESSHGDGNQYGFSATMGVKNDRGGLIIGAGWDVQDPIQQSDRPWSIDPHAGDPNFPGGSTYRTQITDLENALNPSEIWVGAPNSGTINPASCTANPDGTVTINNTNCGQTTTSSSRRNPAIVGQVPNGVYIPGLGIKEDAGGVGYNTLVGERDRKQINFSGHYDVTDDVTFVLQGFYTHYTAEQRLRPEPLQGDTIQTIVNGQVVYPGFFIPANNPYNQTGSAIDANLIPNQFGPRIYDEATDTYRIRAGLEGKLAGDYKWEAGYVDQATDFREDIQNSGNFLHIGELTGQIPCTADAPGGCTNGVLNVPVNFFNGPNIFNAQQLAFAKYTAVDTESSRERFGYGDINGPLFSLPAGQVKGALGFELRDEDLNQEPDSLVQQGYAANPQAPTFGGYHVASVYGEINVPILRDFPFVKSLDFDGSARFDHYSNFGSEVTYKVGGNWQVSRDLRFRGSYATAIRAPQVSELFGGNVISDNGSGGDPCETNPAYGNANFGAGLLTPGSTCAAAIAKAGRSVTNFTDSLDASTSSGTAQAQTLQGGNPNLQPEKARITTGGVIATPRWVPGLSVAADYYAIIISHTILDGGIGGAFGDDVILDGCYGAAQNQNFCNLVSRDASGNINLINSLDLNIGVQKVEGFDYEISYNTRTAHLDQYPVFNMIPGYFNFDVNVENQIKSTQTQPDGTTANFNGFFNTNNETNQPKWKGIFTADYTLDRFHIRYDLRYTRHTYNFNGDPTGTFPTSAAPYSFYGNVVPDFTYHDIAISYDMPPIGVLQKSELIFGVDNLTDKDPPFIATDTTCKCNTIAGPFDVTGRFFYGRLSAHF